MLAYVNSEREKSPIHLLGGKVVLRTNQVTDITKYYDKELKFNKDFQRLVTLKWIVLTEKDPFVQRVKKPIFTPKVNIPKQESVKTETKKIESEIVKEKSDDDKKDEIKKSSIQNALKDKKSTSHETTTEKSFSGKDTTKLKSQDDDE